MFRYMKQPAYVSFEAIATESAHHPLQGQPNARGSFRYPGPSHNVGTTSVRQTGFEPVTFGFVARAGGSAGLRGARRHTVCGGSRLAGIGWSLWGVLPHLLPQLLVGRAELDRRPCGDFVHQNDQGLALQRLRVEQFVIPQRNGILSQHRKAITIE
jgi:hypothetical protein